MHAYMYISILWTLLKCTVCTVHVRYSARSGRLIAQCMLDPSVSQLKSETEPRPANNALNGPDRMWILHE